jgi:hypothetical protein
VYFDKFDFVSLLIYYVAARSFGKHQIEVILFLKVVGMHFKFLSKKKRGKSFARYLKIYAFIVFGAELFPYKK